MLKELANKSTDSMRGGNFQGSWKPSLAKQMPSREGVELAEYKKACVFTSLQSTDMTSL